MDGEAPQEAFEEAFESGSRKNLVRTNTEEGPWQQLPQVQDQRRGLRDSHGRGVQDRGVAFHEEEDLYEMLESDACMRCAQTACFCCGSMRAKKSLGCLASWISHMTIVPATNLTILSLNHQLYLDFVFHRTFAARIGHNLCMPLIFFFFYAWLAQWMPTSVVPPPDAVFDASMLYNGAFGCFVIVQIWWIIWGLISNHQLMGFLVLIPNFLLYLGGSIYFMLLRDTSANATWLWSTTSSWTSPFLLYWLLSLIQSFSHAFDADIPPRMMGEVSWMSLAGTLRRAKESPISFIRVPQFYIASLTQTLFGAVDELCATFRLFPIYALKAAYSYGYKNDYYSVMRLIADFTIATGDPALDYIGIGGSENFSTRTRNERLNPKYHCWFGGLNVQSGDLYTAKEVQTMLDRVLREVPRMELELIRLLLCFGGQLVGPQAEYYRRFLRSFGVYEDPPPPVEWCTACLATASSPHAKIKAMLIDFRHQVLQLAMAVSESHEIAPGLLGADLIDASGVSAQQCRNCHRDQFMDLSSIVGAADSERVLVCTTCHERHNGPSSTRIGRPTTRQSSPRQTEAAIAPPRRRSTRSRSARKRK